MKKAINHINAPQFIKAIYCLLTLLLLTAIASHAQPPDIGGDVDTVPVDGGLSLLVAAGLSYGIRKLSAGRKNKA